jgi:lysophospholipase L1-like esterase
MKVVIAVDSFKGSLTAAQACEIIRNAFIEHQQKVSCSQMNIKGFVSVLAVFVLVIITLSGCSKKMAVAKKQSTELRSIRISIVGDSTVADYPENDPLRGWGQILPEFFKKSVIIINFAKCGESSKSFIKNGLWENAIKSKSDYYLIQFGHNDCPGKGEQTTDPDSDYQEYLTRYINDVRAQGAKPVLVTSMERRVFDKDGKSRLTLDKYADAMKKVGQRYGVPVIDLHEKSIELYQKLGDSGSAYLMTSVDRTHFTDTGARAMARIIAIEMLTKVPEVNAYNIVEEIPASDPNTPRLVVPGDITTSSDGTYFVMAGSNSRFTPWGFNCGFDDDGRINGAKWIEHWPTVVNEFKDMKSLGANVLRVHLQTTKIMSTPTEPNQQALAEFAQVLKLAEGMGLYLDITGLACYNADDVPAWYNDMNEPQRWAVQGRFWEAVSGLCSKSPAVFCYDLMNEPVVSLDPNGKHEWLAGKFGGKSYVQRLTQDMATRTQEQVARAWVDTLVSAIRKHDRHHMITVGEIPWAIVWPGAKPFFASKAIGQNLDFASIHVYPEKGKVAQSIKVVEGYQLGKPIVIEELFPLGCSQDEVDQFIDGTSKTAAGWISHYWRKRVGVQVSDQTEVADLLMENWLNYFQKKTPQILGF